MATFASNVQIYSLGTYSKVLATYEYERKRSGNNMQVRARVKVEWTGSGWMNDPVDVIIDIAGKRALNVNLKPKTSGAIGRSYTSSWSSWQNNATNTGNTSVKYRIYNTVLSSSVNDTRTYNAAAIAPTAPSVPRSLVLPNVAPDKSTTGSWTAPSSGGTNGVSGYESQYSINGAAWAGTSRATVRTRAFSLNSLGVGHGQTFRYRVRAYTTVNGTRYNSAYVTSPTITPRFVAPGNVTSASLTYTGTDPVPNSTYRANWNNGAGGSNGISGYRIRIYINGVQRSSVDTTAKPYTVSTSLKEGDKLQIGIEAYTIGKGTKYYSGIVKTSTITIVADKFLHISVNGGAFTVRKVYTISSSGTVKEIKKNKFKYVI